MTTCLRHMPFQPLDASFGQSQTTHADLLKSRISEIIPKKPVPRSILRSLCLEYNDDKSGSAHAGFRLPGVVHDFPKTVRLDCGRHDDLKPSSPKNLLEHSAAFSSKSSTQFQSSVPSEKSEPISNRLRILLSSYVSRSDKINRPRSPTVASNRENEPCPDARPTKHSSRKRSFTSISDITPVLERYGQLSSNLRSSVDRLKISESSQTDTSSFSSPVSSHRSVLSSFILSRLRNKSVQGAGTDAATTNNNSTENRNISPLAPKKRSSEFLTSEWEYFQPDFSNDHDITFGSLCGSTLHDCSSQASIEVPSWKEDDILAKHIDTLGPSSSLRSRPPKLPSVGGRTVSLSSNHSLSVSKRCSTHTDSTSSDSSRKSCVLDREEEEEITSDLVYENRHAKLEFIEIKRERLSRQRLDEDELRSKLEKRDLDSWRRRHIKRVDASTEINPEKQIPTQLLCPIHEARFVHVIYSIPVVAFGCRVPKPNFGPFRLRRISSS